MTYITIKKEVLEQAIETLELLGYSSMSSNTRSGQAITALRTAIEQAKTVEPVAWMNKEARAWVVSNYLVEDAELSHWIPLYTAPAVPSYDTEKWQPIDTCPPNTHCLVTGGKHVYYGFFDGKNWLVENRGFFGDTADTAESIWMRPSKDTPPTHWMPLPAAPKPEAT